MALPLPAAGAPPVLDPAAVPAAPAAPGAPAVAARVPPSTYRAFFGDESRGPALDRVGDYLHGYRFEGGAVPTTPAALCDQTIALSDRQPMAFLCMTLGTSGNPEITILLHRHKCYIWICQARRLPVFMIGYSA